MWHCQANFPILTLAGYAIVTLHRTSVLGFRVKVRAVVATLASPLDRADLACVAPAALIGPAPTLDSIPWYKVYARIHREDLIDADR